MPSMLRSPLVLLVLVALAVFAVRGGGSGEILATQETPTPDATETPTTPSPTPETPTPTPGTPTPTVTPTATPVPVAPAPAVLGFPAAQCIGFPPVSATVTFTWQKASASFSQWLDLSIFDNNFAPGTFLAAGPIHPDTEQVVWTGILPGIPHFWRINAWTPEGWKTSATGAFVPCGPPSLRFISYSCIGGGRANVTFHWAASSPHGSQWLDLSVFNNDFAFGTFLAAGPLSPFAQELTWPGILANVDHFWRINALIWGWNPSQTFGFRAVC
jgi:hypothetical protein